MRESRPRCNPAARLQRRLKMSLFPQPPLSDKLPPLCYALSEAEQFDASGDAAAEAKWPARNISQFEVTSQPDFGHF